MIECSCVYEGGEITFELEGLYLPNHLILFDRAYPRVLS